MDEKLQDRIVETNGFLMVLKQWGSRGGSNFPGEQTHCEQGRLREALWHTQNKLHINVTTAHLMLVWEPNILGYKTCILIALRLLVHNGKNMHGGLTNSGPQTEKGER